MEARQATPLAVAEPLKLRREFAAPSHVPLAAVNPFVDLVVLAGTLAALDRISLLSAGWAVVAFITLRGLGTQFSRINPRLGDDVGLLAAGLCVPAVVIAPLAGSAAGAGRFVFTALMVTAVLIPARGIAYTVVRSSRARGEVREPTLIVGAGEVGRAVANAMEEHPEYGLVPCGFLDSVTDGDLPLPLLGNVAELEAVVREFGVQRVIIAFGLTREPQMVDVIRACDNLPVEVYLVPRFFELGVAAEGPLREDLWGIPLVRLRRAALRTVAWRTKRVFDLVIGTVALLLTSPLFLLTAAGVRLSSPGPIFFRQTRIGLRGDVIKVLKFRTMRVNEDSDVAWSIDGDERVTFLGKILRRLSLDELPQLLNVLRGDMSLIGPRPERPYFVQRFSGEVARYQDRHRVPVGITGWAQVHGLRGDTSIPERVRFDNYYIEHWSLWTDLVIMVRTIWLILTGRH